MKKVAFLALLLVVVLVGLRGAMSSPRRHLPPVLPYDAATGCPPGYVKGIEVLHPSGGMPPRPSDGRLVCVPDLDGLARRSDYVPPF